MAQQKAIRASDTAGESRKPQDSILHMRMWVVDTSTTCAKLMRNLHGTQGTSQQTRTADRNGVWVQTNTQQHRWQAEKPDSINNPSIQNSHSASKATTAPSVIPLPKFFPLSVHLTTAPPLLEYLPLLPYCHQLLPALLRYIYRCVLPTSRDSLDWQSRVVSCSRCSQFTSGLA